MGYTPLFDSLTKGTLCGKWPDIGLWPIVLSMADKHGVVDCTQAFIAGVTGLPIDDVTACIERFCQPDPCSRSDAAGGARLVLLDSHRAWGWRIVNFDRYRDKARKAAYDAERTASGKDAERKRHERERSDASRSVPNRPALSRAIPLSDSDSDSDKRGREQPSAAPRNSPKPRTELKQRKPSPIPDDFSLSDAMRQKAIGRYPDADVELMFEQFVAHHRAHGKAMRDWSAAWVTWLGNADRFGYPRRPAAANPFAGMR